jgi:hypothetical protein
MGAGRKIENVRKSGENLVLSYSVSALGMAIPVTRRHTPDGGRMRVNMDLEAQFSMGGTATRD